MGISRDSRSGSSDAVKKPSDFWAVFKRSMSLNISHAGFTLTQLGRALLVSAFNPNEKKSGLYILRDSEHVRDNFQALNFREAIGWHALNVFSWPYLLLGGVRRFLFKAIDQACCWAAKNTSMMYKPGSVSKTLKGIVTILLLGGLPEFVAYGISRVTVPKVHSAKIEETTSSMTDNKGSFVKNQREKDMHSPRNTNYIAAELRVSLASQVHPSSSHTFSQNEDKKSVSSSLLSKEKDTASSSHFFNEKPQPTPSKNQSFISMIRNFILK